MEILDSHLRLDRFFANLASARHRLLVLDYDGTLAPFRLARQTSHPYPGVRDRLGRILATRATRLVVLSGRPASEVERLLGEPRPALDAMPEIWGGHGHERKLPGRPVEHTALPAPTRQALADGAAVAARLGWEERLERKSASVAAHARGLAPALAAARQDELRAAWRDIAARGGLRIQPFDQGLELKAPQADKGAALAALLAASPAGSAVAYLGDDLTDEDAFAALPAAGLAVLVRPELRPTRARLWLRPPDELLRFLDIWHRTTTAEAPAQRARATGTEPAP